MFEDNGDGTVTDTTTGQIYDAVTAEPIDMTGMQFNQDYLNAPYAGNYVASSDGTYTFDNGTKLLPDGTVEFNGQTYTMDQVLNSPTIYDSLVKTVSDPGFQKLAGTAITSGLGLLGARAASTSMVDAAAAGINAQSDSAAKAQAIQAQMYNQNRADFIPYMNAGYQGLAQLQGYNQNQGVGAQPNYDRTVTDQLGNYNADPGTVAQKALGQQDLQRNLNARGLNYGATAASAGAQLNQQYDAQGYDKYKGDLTNRYTALNNQYTQQRAANQDQYNKLLDIVKIGTGATSSTGQAGNNYANQTTGILSNLGNATQAGTALGGSAQSQFYSGLGNVAANTATNANSINTVGQNMGWWGK